MQKDFNMQLLLDFLANPSYETKQLGDVCQIIKANPKMNKSQFATSGVPYIHYGQIHNQFNTFTEQPITFAAPELCSKATWANPGDVIITAVSEDFDGIAKPLAWLGDARAVVSGGAMVLKFTELDPLYFAFYLKSYQFRDELRKVASSSTLINLRSNQLGKVNIKIPPLEIQKLIGNFLSICVANAASLDAEVELRKIQFLTIRNQILSLFDYGFNSVKSNPIKAIRDNKVEIEWVRLGDFCSTIRGKVISQQYAAEHPGDYPVYSSQTSNFGEFARIDSYSWDGEYLTWTTDGANAGTVFYRDGKFNITNVCGLIQINPAWQDKIYLKYFYYFLQRYAPDYVNRTVSNPKLMSNIVEDIEIPILPLEHQKFIGDSLWVMENYIQHPEYGLELLHQRYLTLLEYYIDKFFQ